jgi:hypothetical protein
MPVLRKYWIRDALTALRGVVKLWNERSVVALVRIFLWVLANRAGLGVPSATPLTRHRIGERLGVRASSVLGGMHCEKVQAPALA